MSSVFGATHQSHRGRDPRHPGYDRTQRVPDVAARTATDHPGGLSFLDEPGQPRYREAVLFRVEPVATTPAAYAFAVVLGLLWGSFANVCIYRWPLGGHVGDQAGLALLGLQDADQGGTTTSRCSATCGCAGSAARARRRSRRATCSSRRSPARCSASRGGSRWGRPGMLEPIDVRVIRFVVAAGFVFVMIVITFIDLDTQLILDKVTIPSIVIFFRLAAPAGASLVRRPGRHRDRLRRAVADRRAVLPDPQARGPGPRRCEAARARGRAVRMERCVRIAVRRGRPRNDP